MNEYDWDDAKRETNIAKHGLDFAEVWKILEGDHILEEARPGAGDEPRFKATGMIDALCATVIFTLRDDAKRIITLRRARTKERTAFDAALHQRTAATDGETGRKPH